MANFGCRHELLHLGLSMFKFAFCQMLFFYILFSGILYFEISVVIILSVSLSAFHCNNIFITLYDGL